MGRAPDPVPVTLDPRYFDNPKIQQVGIHGRELHLRSLCHANLHVTDGFVDHADGIRLARESLTTGLLVEPTVSEALQLIDSLVDAGLWHHADGGFEIHDYALYQETRESIHRKERGRRRKALTRIGGAHSSVAKKVRERDGDLCRYCHKTVDWKDRRGPDGGTYDHVDPDGENSLENVVVACRSCNASKGARTPEQAAMSMWSPPDLGRSESDLDPLATGDLEVEVLDLTSKSTSTSLGFDGALPVTWDELRELVEGLRGANERSVIAVANVLRGLPEAALWSALEMAKRPAVRNQAGYLVTALKDAREKFEGRAASA